MVCLPAIAYYKMNGMSTYLQASYKINGMPG